MRARSDDGTVLYYELEGPDDAPTVMLSNSLGTALGMWDAQMEALLRRFRVLRYDARGHGRSDAPDGPYTLDRLGRDAVAVMNAAEVRPVHFVGLSMGGMTGMWLATHHPGRVGRLVLANTAAHMPPPDLWDGRIRTVERHGMTTIVDSVVERWFTESFRENSLAAVEPVHAMVQATSPTGYAACCAAIRDMDQREAIKAIVNPTLIIAGRHDPATTLAQAEELHTAIQGSRLEVLEAAHLSNIEAPKAFSAAMMQFLSGERGTDGAT